MKLYEKLSSTFVLIMQKFLAKKQSKSGEQCEETKRSNKAILAELAYVQNQLELAYVAFNSQTNFDLIESNIYYIGSLETRCNYLIKEARKRRLNCVLKSV